MATAKLPRERSFTVSEYRQMARTGILGEDDRVELIDGKIIARSPIGSRHAYCVDRLTRMLILDVGNQATVRVQNPVQLSDRSEPEPDLALIEPKEVYVARHPRPDEVLLLIEVAETSLTFDQRVKVPLYAQAGIPEVWLIALDDEQVYVYRQPGPSGYVDTSHHKRGDALKIVALPDVGPFAVEDLLGP